ncbi:unnamed protein product, partial [Musa acuminata var. zebrina]
KVEAQEPIPAKIDGFACNGAPVWGQSVDGGGLLRPFVPRQQRLLASSQAGVTALPRSRLRCRPPLPFAVLSLSL